MPPLLAFVICAALVAALMMQIDRKQAYGCSMAIWVPSIWMLYYASRPLVGWFGAALGSEGEMDVAAGSPMDRSFMIVLMALALIVLAKRRVSIPKILREHPWLFLFFAYMLASVIWSQFPLVSIKRWFRAVGSILMALVILTEADPGRAFRSVLLKSIYILIPFSVLLVKYFPEFGIDYGRWDGAVMWVGVTTQKNSLGRLCLVSAAFLVWSLIRRWRGSEEKLWKFQDLADVLMLLMTAWLLKGPRGSYSATSVALVLVSIGLFLVLVARKSAPRLMLQHLTVLLAICILAMAAMSISGFTPTSGLEMLGREGTFTGRTAIWDQLREIAWKQPILGLGYGSFWIYPPENILVNEGHNGYLDVFLDLGLIGVVLLVILLVNQSARILRYSAADFDWACFNFVFLLILVFHNFTETSFALSASHLWTVFLFLSLLTPLENPSEHIESEAALAEGAEVFT